MVAVSEGDYKNLNGPQCGDVSGLAGVCCTAASSPTRPLVKLDRHDAENVNPFGLGLENLPWLRIGGFARQEEVKRFAGNLRAGERVDLH